MKKIFSALLVIFALGFASQTVSAQSCAIRGSNGDTVQVFSSSLNGSSVDITLGSDSQDAATIDVSVTVTYAYGNKTDTRTFTDKCIAQPSQPTQLSIRIDPSIGQYPYDFKPAGFDITLSGNKCQ